VTLPAGSSLWSLITARASVTPDAVMLVDEAGQTLTFDGYRQVAERCAAGLSAAGVSPGDRVAWQLPTSLVAAVVMAALSRIGAVQVPIIPVLRSRDVSFIVGQSEATTIITPGVWRGFDYGALAEEVAGPSGCRVLTVSLDIANGLPYGDPASLPAATPGGTEERWIFYTSGTTAQPKGVRHSDATAMAASNGMCLIGRFDGTDVLSVPIPITHIGGLMTLTTILRSGCRALLVEAFDPAGTPLLAARHGITVLFAAGSMYRAYLSAQASHGPEPLYPNLRMCCNGGAAVPLKLHQEVKAVLGGIGVTSSWGLTESPADTFPPLDSSDANLSATVGVPVPGVELRVVGPDGAEVPRGAQGELRLRGPQRFLGYVDGTLDAAAIDDEGYLRTGDLGVLQPDGYVRITGRLKDVVIRNAENISAREVEEVVAALPGVADVAVIGVPDARTGERCCAVVELANRDALVDLDAVIAHCRAAGMAVHKIPEQVEVVAAIPRNDLGKIQKAALRAQFANG
jgi:cyclohexanecarboxylate-CoA ligase